MPPKSYLPIEELCEHLLAHMAQLTQQRGHQRGIRLDQVARERWGVEDLCTVQAALEGLIRQGYAEDMRIAGCVMAKLTAEGLARYENGGEVSLESGRLAVDKGTTFYGPISNSNLAVHSRGVSQSHTVSHIGSVASGLLDQIEEALKRDRSISEEEREAALADTESLRRELARDRPRQNRVREFISGLGNLSSITSFVIQLSQLASQLPLV